MSALIADPPQQQQEALEAPPTPAAKPCPNCGAALAPGQNWCLECGSAVPGRLGRSGGLRASLGIVSITLLLVCGAVAAAYAALSSSASKATKAPVTVATTPAPPSPAPAAPPAPANAKRTLPKLPPRPAATATPKPAPAKPAPVASKPAKPTTKPAPAKPAPSGPIVLDTNAASTYNPYNYAPSTFGDPALTVDGDATTAWTYQLDPAAGGKTAAGVVLDLKTPLRVRQIKLITRSPGMTAEFYGASGALPVSIIDPNWTHLATRRHLRSTQTVALKTAGRSFRYLLIWIAHAPSGHVKGAVDIAELTVSA